MKNPALATAQDGSPLAAVPLLPETAGGVKASPASFGRRRKKRESPERDLQARIIKLLQAMLTHRRDVFWTAIPGGDGRITLAPGYRSGTPDLMIVYRGRAVFIELKAPKNRALKKRGGRVSPTQELAHEDITLAGGLVTVCTTGEQVRDFVKAVLSAPAVKEAA